MQVRAVFNAPILLHELFCPNSFVSKSVLLSLPGHTAHQAPGSFPIPSKLGEKYYKVHPQTLAPALASASASATNVPDTVNGCVPVPLRTATSLKIPSGTSPGACSSPALLFFYLHKVPTTRISQDCFVAPSLSGLPTPEEQFLSL